MFHVVKQLKRSTKKSHQKTRICLLLCVCVESDVKTPCLPFDNMSWDNELKRSEKYRTEHTTCLSNIKDLIKYCDVFWLLSLIHAWTALYKLFIIHHNLPCSILSDAIFAWQISGKGLVKMFSIVFPILLAPLVILLTAHCHNLLKICKFHLRFHVLNCFSTTSCIVKMWSTVE